MLATWHAMLMGFLATIPANVRPTLEGARFAAAGVHRQRADRQLLAKGHKVLERQRRRGARRAASLQRRGAFDVASSQSPWPLLNITELRRLSSLLLSRLNAVESLSPVTVLRGGGNRVCRCHDIHSTQFF